MTRITTRSITQCKANRQQHVKDFLNQSSIFDFIVNAFDIDHSNTTNSTFISRHAWQRLVFRIDILFSTIPHQVRSFFQRNITEHRSRWRNVFDMMILLELIIDTTKISVSNFKSDLSNIFPQYEVQSYHYPTNSVLFTKQK